MNKRLFLQFRSQVLHVLAQDRKGKLSFESVSLRELPTESLVAKFRSLRGAARIPAVLVVPREELLAQAFELPGTEQTFKKALYAKLEKSFPYRVEELSYGVRVTQESAERVKGSFVAAPNEKLP